jgi:hypothetical protein
VWVQHSMGAGAAQIPTHNRPTVTFILPVKSTQCPRSTVINFNRSDLNRGRKQDGKAAIDYDAS